MGIITRARKVPSWALSLLSHLPLNHPLRGCRESWGRSVRTLLLTALLAQRVTIFMSGFQHCWDLLARLMRVEFSFWIFTFHRNIHSSPQKSPSRPESTTATLTPRVLSVWTYCKTSGAQPWPSPRCWSASHPCYQTATPQTLWWAALPSSSSRTGWSTTGLLSCGPRDMQHK